MELKLSSSAGGSEVVNVSDAIFAREFNQDLVHQAVICYQAGARQGSKAQKNRAAVSGGGKKPWRQKGTGRARAGTIRSPIWRSGGVTFAASPRNYEQKINRKMYRSAIKCILSELARQDRLVVVNEFAVESHKTKQLLDKLNSLGLDNVLIVVSEVSENLYLAARNLHSVEVVDVKAANPVSLVGFDKVLVTVEALKQFEEVLV